MLKQTETEETTGFNVTFLSLVAFQLGPGPPRLSPGEGRTFNPRADYFLDKTKISEEYLRVDYFLQLKHCWKQCTLLPSIPGPNHLQNLTPKCRISNVVWTCIVSKSRIEQFNFFNWLSNSKNLVLSYGFEHVRDVIQWY